MIFSEEIKKNPGRVYFQNKPVMFIYFQGKKVWGGYANVIISCFAKGYWEDNDPWTDDYPWADNP